MHIQVAPLTRWWPAVYADDGVPTEWWLVTEGGEVLAKQPFVPGIVPGVPGGNSHFAV